MYMYIHIKYTYMYVYVCICVFSLKLLEVLNFLNFLVFRWTLLAVFVARLYVVVMAVVGSILLDRYGVRWPWLWFVWRFVVMNLLSLH